MEFPGKQTLKGNLHTGSLLGSECERQHWAEGGVELSQGRPEPFPVSSGAQMDLPSCPSLSHLKSPLTDQGGAVTSNTAKAPSS